MSLIADSTASDPRAQIPGGRDDRAVRAFTVLWVRRARVRSLSTERRSLAARLSRRFLCLQRQSYSECFECLVRLQIGLVLRPTQLVLWQALRRDRDVITPSTCLTTPSAGAAGPPPALPLPPAGHPRRCRLRCLRRLRRCCVSVRTRRAGRWPKQSQQTYRYRKTDLWLCVLRLANRPIAG